MALSEAEELELLSLERERAMAAQQQSSPERSIAPILPKMMGVAAQDVAQRFGPAIGPVVGGLLGGPGGAAGVAGLTAIGQRMAGIANGSQPSVPMSDPNAWFFPSSPLNMTKEAISPAIQAGAAGIAQEPKLLQEIPGVPKVTELVSKLASQAGKGLAKAGPAFSGAKAGDLAEAAGKGLPTYAADSLPEAGGKYAKALEKLPGEDIAPTVADKIDSALTPESSAGAKFLRDMGKRIDNGELITARQALKAKQSLDDVIDSVPIWQVKRRGALFDLKNTFDDVLT